MSTTEEIEHAIFQANAKFAGQACDACLLEPLIFSFSEKSGFVKAVQESKTFYDFYDKMTEDYFFSF